MTAFISACSTRHRNIRETYCMVSQFYHLMVTKIYAFFMRQPLHSIFVRTQVAIYKERPANGKYFGKKRPGQLITTLKKQERNSVGNFNEFLPCFPLNSSMFHLITPFQSKSKKFSRLRFICSFICQFSTCYFICLFLIFLSTTWDGKVKNFLRFVRKKIPDRPLFLWP